MRLPKFLVLCLLVLSAARPLAAAGPDREAELRAEVSFFCDSLCAGRGFGSDGEQYATFYLIRQLRDAGLRTTVQTFSAAGRAGHNVVAVTPGWYRRYIVVGAYADGLGKLGGRLYPGADANASGLAALLALARELPADARRDIGLVFVAFDGHAADLAGAAAFLEQFREQYPALLMVNLDQLGSSLAPVRKDRPDYLIALGGAPYRFALESANRSTAAGRAPGLDLSYDYYGSTAFTEMFYRRVSDQRCFLEAGIPAVMFTSGITGHTNKITDTPATLDYPLLDRRISLISTWLRSQL
ncbi:MAG: M28 family peptidase [Bacteroidales bacterium]|nr:M28 family peptidase [Bacteroidales bacterium]